MLLIMVFQGHIACLGAACTSFAQSCWQCLAAFSLNEGSYDFHPILEPLRFPPGPYSAHGFLEARNGPLH